MLQPTDKLSLTLEAQTWNNVMAVLGKAAVPYEVLAPLIHELQRQCNEQAQAVDGPRTVQGPRPVPNPDQLAG